VGDVKDGILITQLVSITPYHQLMTGEIEILVLSTLTKLYLKT